MNYSPVSSSAESAYARRVPMEHRKKYAQFFTPAPIASVMTDWLCANPNLHTVLEPAFGLGIFSRDLLRKRPDVRIKAYDIDRVIVSEARGHFTHVADLDLQQADYICNDWDCHYDGIVCNPPYFKFHDYDNQRLLHEINGRLRCQLNGFTNLYSLFLIKSISQLNTGGRCAYVVPSEFLNADYGVPVKEYLLRSRTLRHVIVFDFKENVFDDALTTACIILCAKDDKDGAVDFTCINDAVQDGTLRQILDSAARQGCTRTYPLATLRADRKWRVYYKAGTRSHYCNLVPFTRYAKVMRGIATGANDYFLFNQSKAAAHQISRQHLLPCVSRCADVRGRVFTEADFNALAEADKKVFLLNATDTADPNVRQYLLSGVKAGIDRRYLTASRNPWYAIERRKPAPIWVSVFNRTGLRFVRNVAGVANLTTFHCLYPQQDLFANVSVEVLFAYLSTETAREILELNCREYADGLQKFEPNDLNKSQMPDLATLPSDAKRELAQLAQSMDAEAAAHRADEIIRQHFVG